jgi:phosphatidylethanolamine-binding protein (PEBP) family uncharacterized protein
MAARSTFSAMPAPPRWPRAFLATTLASTLLLGVSACGSSSNSSTAAKSPTGQTGATGSGAPPSAPQQSSAHLASLSLSTSARTQYGGIATQYTCHGANTSPPVAWTPRSASALANAKEIVIMVRTLQHGPLQTNWAVAGISPSVHEISAGSLPAGAVVGRNSLGKVGYSLCPEPSGIVTIGVYALPHKLSFEQGFDFRRVRPALESPEVNWGGMTLYKHEMPVTTTP